ncbi:sulfate adenylyltransferase subunit 1 [Anaerobacterium chartisolvens]|uniref:sulfate adenylyltransferase n=1 Tax=Anaerobacterium chartisolvens TaxID=1297424 RepID=A0A369B752_9FIRM|nr:GTP-binding protein [Anaerobacterium chartisolvens]RCX17251.1 sulfate adenylyltransferase subunit 1 [Anaerobacterium chartisolvens]
MTEENVKEILKIVVVGHVDHGKSTVIGRLLYDTKSLPEGAIDRVKRISKEKGKPFEYAYLLDAFEEEQKQGITIDTTQLQFHTEKREYVIIDAPGHKEFLKNMISGAANAEAALVIIDANEGIQEQSKRHGYILSLLGIQKVYVIVNKMDLIDYSEQRFNAIKLEMNQFLNSLKVYPLRYIPVSAFLGENIALKSDKMPWYDGSPILESIDMFEKDKGLEEKPLRLPIQDVYKFDNRRIIAGRIESGRLRVGDEILISPSRKLTRIKTIEYWTDNDKRDTAEAGMSVGITVEDEFFNKRGEIITHKDEAPVISDVFKVNLFWMGRNNLVKDKKYKIKAVTQEMECEVVSIDRVIDATTLEAIEDASRVKTNDVAEVTIRTKEKLCFDQFKSNQNTGRFVIVDGYDVCGGGIVSGVEALTNEVSRFVREDEEIVVSCFDEYFYMLPEGAVRKATPHHRLFVQGDSVPLEGETYFYPDSVDIIDVRRNKAVLVRKGIFTDIMHFEDYKYSGIPAINTSGFYINISSHKLYEEFKEDLGKIDVRDGKELAAFANKWFDIMKGRRIIYKESSELYQPEYTI